MTMFHFFDSISSMISAIDDLVEIYTTYETYVSHECYIGDRNFIKFEIAWKL